MLKVSCRKCEKVFIKKTNSVYCQECKSIRPPCACGCKCLVSPLKEYKKGHGRKGRNNTPAHNLAISNANKGRAINRDVMIKVWAANRGKTISLETRRKMSVTAKSRGFGKWMLGRKISKEAIAKRTSKMLGHKVSDSTRQAISRSNSDKGNGMYGYAFSKEQIGNRRRNAIFNWAKKEYRDKIVSTKIARGIIKDPSLYPDYVRWEKKVDSFTNSQYRKHRNAVDPQGLRSRSMPLDHILSKHEAYLKGLPPCVVGSFHNLRILDVIKNSSKNYRSDHSIECLLQKICGTNI